MTKFSNTGFSAAIVIVGFNLVANAGSAQASEYQAGRCQGTLPEPFPAHHSFLLNDPRSGLMLFLESDGRHLAAITHDGKIVWQRNLFDDPKLEMSISPPPTLPGEKPMSDHETQRWMQSYWRGEYIDRIGVVSDCETQIIDHRYTSRLLRGHYVRAGSGTQIFYLLDAKTGDFMVEAIN
jgi:hypothetical protein